MEKMMNKITMYIWAVLGLLCLGGVLFAKAWWHIPTCLLCYAMYRSFGAEVKEVKETKKD